MGMMPDWVTKTTEMAAFDKYFSFEKGEAELERRYRSALERVTPDPKHGMYWDHDGDTPKDADALLTELGHDATVQAVESHFVTD